MAVGKPESTGCREVGPREPGGRDRQTDGHGAFETPAEPEESWQCSRPDLGREQGCWARGIRSRRQVLGDQGSEGRPLSHMGP